MQVLSTAKYSTRCLEGLVFSLLLKDEASLGSLWMMLVGWRCLASKDLWQTMNRE
jgi:hypothetical protein